MAATETNAAASTAGETVPHNDAEERSENAGAAVGDVALEPGGTSPRPAASEAVPHDDGPRKKPCCCGGGEGAPRYKHTPRPDDFQRDVQKRLNRVIGQLNGVKNMIDENRYCGDVLTQLAAAESAVKRISDMVLHEHLETCVVERVQGGDTEVIDEVMDLIRKFK